MEKETSTPDKRKDLRVPILVTRVKGGKMGRTFFGYAKNISRSGLFIQTINPKKEKEQFKIEFTLPGEETSVTCTAEVVWARNYMPDALYEPGMGLRFLDLEDEKADEIARWVERNTVTD